MINFIKNNSLVIIFAVIAVVTRFLPHPANFAPMVGVSIFLAYHLKNKWSGLALSIFLWWASNLIMNNIIYSAYFPTFSWLGGSFLAVAISLIIIHFLSQFTLKNIKFSNQLVTSIIGSTIFFVITNFSVFYDSNLYSQDLAGLSTCFLAAIPFFKMSLLGDLFYTTVMFGAYNYFLSTTKQQKIV